MNKLYREIYNDLDIDEKKELLYKIERENHGFRIIGFEEFSRFGQKTFTAIYDYHGSEFVFVPGDTVTLGFDDFTHDMDENIKSEILDTL